MNNKVSRVTLIDHRKSKGSPGIIFEAYNLGVVDVVYQDDARTIKIFINDKKEPENA